MKYIMLHGLGQSSESWSDTVKVFNDDFEVLCPTPTRECPTPRSEVR